MKTIVEIGGGRTPYFIRYDLPVSDNTRYVCLDVTEKNVEMAENKLAEHKKAGRSVPEEVFFEVHDAVTIPIPDSYVDEVIISNTLSAPIHHDWDRNGTKTKDRSIDRENHSDPFYAERKPMVEEALRILKPGGSLWIYTDLIIYGIHSYEKILEELENHPYLETRRNWEEEIRIDQLNKEKIESDDHCCCFRAEVLPNCSVYEFIKRG